MYPFSSARGNPSPEQTSVIAIQFKDSPHKIFKDDVEPNRLIISIQPELEICLLFESKVPGLEMKLQAVDMDFTYQENYTESLPEAYEALLLDVLEGDATLFHAGRPGGCRVESSYADPECLEKISYETASFLSGRHLGPDSGTRSGKTLCTTLVSATGKK